MKKISLEKAEHSAIYISVVGGIIATITNNVIFAVAPMTFSLLLFNSVNRDRLQKNSDILQRNLKELTRVVERTETDIYRLQGDLQRSPQIVYQTETKNGFVRLRTLVDQQNDSIANIRRDLELLNQEPLSPKNSIKHKSTFPYQSESNSTDTRNHSRYIRKSVRVNVLSRDGSKCVLCGRTSQEISLEIDHILPFSQGGSNDPDNLQTLCRDCNRGKGARNLS